jgi:tetraacyldisaccharide 4'-kinase
MAVVDRLGKLGRHPAVISRGYKGLFAGIQEVSLNRKGAAKWYGDEPVLIKSRYRDMPVIVGVDRVEAAKTAMKIPGVDILVADDAFQHRRLGRNLDILVIDSTQSTESLHPLPWGLGRENVDGLKRAQLIVLSKMNLSGTDRLNAWENLIATVCPGTPVIKMAYRPGAMLDFEGKAVARDTLKSGFLVAAIGQPDAFVTLVERELEVQVRDRIFFADHHDFVTEDLDRILRRMEARERLIVTEKDAVKLKDFDHPVIERLVVVPVAADWVDSTEKLDHALAACTA